MTCNRVLIANTDLINFAWKSVNVEEKTKSTLPKRTTTSDD